MKQDIVVPRVGESVASGVIATWLKKEGQMVKAGEEIFELETDKATLPVTALADGVLHQGVAVGTEVAIGAVVGYIDTAATAAAPAVSTPATTPAAPAPATAQAAAPAAKSAAAVVSPVAAQAGPAAPAAASYNLEGLSPAVRALVAENGLNPALIRGSGPGGRITKEDVQAYISLGRSAAPASASAAAHASAAIATTHVAPTQSAAAAAQPAPSAGAGSAAGSALSAALGPQPPLPVEAGRQERVAMTNLRKSIARRMVESKLAAAHLTTFNEVDMLAASDARKRYKESFEAKHGVRLGFMSFFVKASQIALSEFPMVNAFVDGTDIIHNHFYDISVAVSTDKGLLTPVLRGVEGMSFADIERGIADFGKRAKERKIMPDELSGGTFTISNGGVFGSMLSTPIPNPPQTAVLGMHSIQERPVVRDGQIVIRPMMYLALTYDHRILDGKDAISFLKRIKDLIEDPWQMLLGV